MLFNRILLVAVLVFSNSLLLAQSVSVDIAMNVAKKQLIVANSLLDKTDLKLANIQLKDISLSHCEIITSLIDTLYYVFNVTNDNGFVIVSADKRVQPILGYSLHGKYAENDQPPAFIEWMENKKNEIAHIKGHNLQPDTAITNKWNNLSSNDIISESTSISPIIHTTWNQTCYYNALCPADADAIYFGMCGFTATGCVATAMAQIMKYWNFPTTGIGSHSYVDPTYGTLYANFGNTTYQWNQMPVKVTSSNNAVATLMYHCGVSIDTNYGPDGSWIIRTMLTPKSGL